MKTLVMGLVAMMMSCAEMTKKDSKGNQTNGPVVTRNISVDKPFTGIVINGSATVSYTQKPGTAVVVEADSAQFSRLEITVKDGCLVIGTKATVNVFSWFADGGDGDVKVRVSSPDLTAVIVKGSGEFTAGGRIDTDHLELAVNGSGSVNFPHGAICDRIKAKVVGSGDIVANGVDALEADLKVTGSGDMNIVLQNARQTSASITGSGDLNLTCRRCQRVDASVTGSGDLTIGGTVREVNRKTVGSGDIECTVTRW